MTAIAHREPAGSLAQPSALAQRLGLSQEKLELVRTQIAPGAPDDVIELYFEMCRVSGFDPFAKMLHCVGRNAKVDGQWTKRWTFQTAIDGFRSIAEDTGEYDGQDEPEHTFDDKGRLRSTTVRVYRKGMSRPIAATADWDEYVQTDKDGVVSSMWRKMPRVMLAKCAEALALRKAFPKRLAGIYTSDEMGQQDNAPAIGAVHAPGPVSDVLEAEFQDALPTAPPTSTRAQEVKAKIARQRGAVAAPDTVTEAAAAEPAAPPQAAMDAGASLDDLVDELQALGHQLALSNEEKAEMLRLHIGREKLGKATASELRMVIAAMHEIRESRGGAPDESGDGIDHFVETKRAANNEICSKAQRSEIAGLRQALGMAEEPYREFLHGMTAGHDGVGGKKSATELTVDEAAVVIRAMKEMREDQIRAADGGDAA